MYRVSSMIRRVIALGTLVVVLLCGATPASAFVVIDADIYGWITDTETGEGIDGATVWLYYFDSQWGWLYPFDTTTVSSGYYSFKGLSSGTEYYMQVTHPRYRRNARATGWTGPTVRADLALRPLVQRIWGNNRYSTAEAITRKVWSGGGTQWPTVTDVVIASGEDRASADPLAAAGLCWLYDAPLFLVSSTQVPGEVKEAIRQIAVARHPGRIALHVVGGTTSIPAARIREITDYATAGTTDPDIDRVLSSGDRYDLAAAIALRMKQKSLSQGKLFPSEILIANGADPTKFFDALALSTISALRGNPILLVSVDNLPSATASALALLGPSRVIVGGGPNTVGGNVFGDLGLLAPSVERWWGSNRYSTAIAIADKASTELSPPTLMYDFIGTASKIPDALAGGAFLGHYGGMLVLTKGNEVPAETAAWLEAHDAENGAACYVFGGPNSVSESVREKLTDILVH